MTSTRTSQPSSIALMSIREGEYAVEFDEFMLIIVKARTELDT